MLQQLINHNNDIRQLVDKGYEVEIRGGQFILVHHIPYVNSKGIVDFGVLVDSLVLKTTEIVGSPKNHTVYFIGDLPCDKNGAALAGFINNSNQKNLGHDIVANHYFSARPHPKFFADRKYPDYYEKFRTYAELITVHAQQVDPSVTATPGRVRENDSYKSVFRYPNTNASKANISANSEIFYNQKIAIIGIGGTGSYILDQISKTEVAGIHLFDDDEFELHNAFRAPGAARAVDFNNGKQISKVAYFAEVYSEMHLYIHPHKCRIDKSNITELYSFDFVFICVDNAESRHFISSYLKDKKIPFIDTGLGVKTVENTLIGSIRITTVTPQANSHLETRIGSEDLENEYDDNIQIADLNCLNATLAVIRWKKFLGYYQDLKSENNSMFFINTGKLLHEDFDPQVC